MDISKDIYRICSLGKTLTETIQEVIHEDPQSKEIIEKIWKIYDTVLDEEMSKLQNTPDATINGKLETFQRIPLENSNNNKQVCRLVVKDAKIDVKYSNNSSKIDIKPQYLKIVAYEQASNKDNKNKKKSNAK
ncbi:transcription initiation factor IIA, gamma subunit, helical domain protein (macronuclear) [Tetrahymena thermophila SB210]|uniref:Transcription initiation factor IIA, gamma subunit, helical domain protein n=1 Tax=Tetrahymena thermophila (strain SB210) TaxID=312017 RepID=Q22Y86_TETTS|nr:transcription initiation factor IIA, gamma subunit, helical domain protein [Tetrahymena thermophila SB210]EAR90138.1 transcription initiation factor IIA, gamma subunit, helical domain protein [Tetrahymena thermophila SB210]|eukprot:XP_001010383.1 transcription initiation factor IIA, gamma subunit, helical domain protein [Tetrahymena thermophila SB210]